MFLEDLVAPGSTAKDWMVDRVDLMKDNRRTQSRYFASFRGKCNNCNQSGTFLISPVCTDNFLKVFFLVIHGKNVFFHSQLVNTLPFLKNGNFLSLACLHSSHFFSFFFSSIPYIFCSSLPLLWLICSCYQLCLIQAIQPGLAQSPRNRSNVVCVEQKDIGELFSFMCCCCLPMYHQ